MATYSYIIPDLIFLDKLHEYLSETFDINSFYLTIEGFNVDIHFLTELDTQDKNNLNTLINVYNPPQTKLEFYSTDIIQILNDNISNTNYSLIGSYLWTNINPNIIPSSFKIVTLLIPQNTSDNYSIRIYDTMNNNILSELTNLTNTTLQIFNLTSISNIPKNETVLEIQIKCSNPLSKVFCNNANILFSIQIN